MNPVISCGTCAACQSGYGNVCSNLKLMGIHVNGGFEEYTKVGVDKLVAVEDVITSYSIHYTNLYEYFYQLLVKGVIVIVAMVIAHSRGSKHK